jgi:hypothetical protein
VRLVLERRVVQRLIARLSTDGVQLGEDARAAVEWLTADDEEGASAVFTARRLQLFLWYELPRKWLIAPDEHLGVAAALGAFFDESGSRGAALAALCRAQETIQILSGDGDVEFAALIEASGLEPPDTPMLEWSDLMTIEESLERDAVAEMLEQAVDDAALVPRTTGWRRRQAQLVERYLVTPDVEGTPLARIHAARRESWVSQFAAVEERRLVATVIPRIEERPLPSEAEAAIEPLLWLLERLADGVKLTQTGALPRSLVRDAVDRYPDWWDVDLFGPPHRAAEVYSLDVLHTIVNELNLAYTRRGVLKVGPRGRSLQADPPMLLSVVASAIASLGGSVDLDLALADLLSEENVEPDFRLLHLLGPFYGIIGGRFRREVEVTPGGRTLAAAILRARAYGPRHSFS